ncbi:hypothetical protein F994_00170 [Acinetobacter bohemicus ANC 3994]|uniref:Helix-turn-helix domain-containing protein n=1 Tax=Acinetobacter bohemicus ANC 3994 TaxID=1217715 RepID=N8P3V8_9GAMM|nr:plasmid replication DNA-binding protein [Acinetobacter bohemicus]ENU21296.1 hypothetical protein F994_00170 [Acinetobacter bohemicus ANC 3994]
MSLVTIVEASKQFGIGRTAIYKAIKRGDLTAKKNNDGVQVVDAQDMVRLFGSSRKANVSIVVSGNSMLEKQQDSEQVIQELREQLKELKQDKEFLKQEISSIRKDFDDYKLMITYKGNLSSVETEETVSKNEKNNVGVQEKHNGIQPETPNKARVEDSKKDVLLAEEQLKLKKGFFRKLFF